MRHIYQEHRRTSGFCLVEMLMIRRTYIPLSMTAPIHKPGPHDELADRHKPCGYEDFCPLIDESRLFADAEFILVELGLSYRERRSLAYLAIAKWCKHLAASGYAPELPECRATMLAAADAYQQADPKARIRRFTTACYRAFAAREHRQVGAGARLARILSEQASC